MTDEAWIDRIAAERMQTDREFADRVAASPLSSQQWGLVMTAVEFDIEGAEDPESARLIADTGKLDSVMTEIRRMDEGGPGGATPGVSGGDGDGLLSGVKDVLGLGGSDDELRLTAEQLAEEYAVALQERLEERGRWQTICERVGSA